MGLVSLRNAGRISLPQDRGGGPGPSHPGVGPVRRRGGGAAGLPRERERAWPEGRLRLQPRGRRGDVPAGGHDQPLLQAQLLVRVLW